MSNTTTANTSSTTKTANATNKEQSQHEQTTVSAKADRERPIESGRDNTRAGDRNRTGLLRQHGSGTRLSTAHSPFSLMNRMAEDMDRLFQQLGFGSVRVCG